MKSIDTLIEDIYSVASLKVPPVEGDHISMSVSYSKWWDKPWERKDKHLSFSEIGTPCLRKLWYEVNSPEHKEQIDGNLRIKFLYGDMLESLCLSLASSAGHTVERQQERVAYTVGNGWTISGKLDAIIDGVVVDVKSTTKHGEDKFEKGLVDDPFGYKDQLTGYAVATNNDRAGFITIQKELGHIKYFPIVVDKPRFQERALVATTAVECSEPDSLGRLPPVHQSATSKNMKLDVTCSYCPYKKVCWPSLRTFMYANGPTYLVHVVDVPKVMEVV